MPLTIDRVSLDLKVGEEVPRTTAATETARDDDRLREVLRPVVLQILTDELERLRREQG